jgi:hypothetical protein
MDYKEAMHATGLGTNDPASHQGTSGAAYLSKYIFDIYMSIHDRGTPEQFRKYKELQNSYVKVVGDLTHVYRLEQQVQQYQHIAIGLKRENDFLKSEVEKLRKSLDFDNY